jgi:hypothetical protein
MAFFKRELSPVERFESALKDKQAARQKLARNDPGWRRLELDPLSEEASIDLMHALGCIGDRAALEKVLDTVRRKDGPIHGMIHPEIIGVNDQ